jgi:hypothetical protein
VPAAFFAHAADDASLDRAALSDPDNPFLIASYMRAQQALGCDGWLLGVEEHRVVQGAALCFLKSGRLRRSLTIPASPPVPVGSPFWPGLDSFCRDHGITDLEISTFATPESIIPPIRGETKRVQRTEFALPLAGRDLWAGVSKGHRERVKKGRKNGLTMRREHSDAAIDAHVALHINSMDRRKSRGEHVSLEFERDVSAALLTSGAGELFQAMLGDHVASSLLILRSPKGAYSESSGNSREGMNIGASHFLRYETATVLQSEGIEMFYFGGARAHEEGLRAYKSGFGTTPIDTEAVTAYVGGRLRRGVSAVVESLQSATRSGSVR